MVSDISPSNSFLLVDTDTTDAINSAPKVKKAKMTLGPDQTVSQPSGLHADISIISIDDIEDPQSEQLNKTDATADIKEFFTSVPPGPGQDKVCMKCNLCA
jgi:hypothetical protein